MTDSKELQKVEGGQLPAGAGEIPDMIRWALENDANVEVMERIVALQERVSLQNARMAFSQALSAFRAECPQPKKTRENIQFSVTRGGVKRHSMYSPLEEIDRVARPVAAAHGLAWTWDTKIEGDFMYVTCKLFHVAGHSETSTVPMPWESKAGSSPQQKLGSTQQYGMRYSLIAALGITTADEDLDGNAPDGSGQAITEGEAADLDQKIRESEANRARILEFACVERLEEVQAANLPMLNRLLDEKIAALKAREAK